MCSVIFFRPGHSETQRDIEPLIGAWCSSFAMSKYSTATARNCSITCLSIGCNCSAPQSASSGTVGLCMGGSCLRSVHPGHLSILRNHLWLVSHGIQTIVLVVIAVSLLKRLTTSLTSSQRVFSSVGCSERLAIILCCDYRYNWTCWLFQIFHTFLLLPGSCQSTMGHMNQILVVSGWMTSRRSLLLHNRATIRTEGNAENLLAKTGQF